MMRVTSLMHTSLAVFGQAVANTFRRAARGLYAGKHIQFGNNVPFSKHKTRRIWLPNVHYKRLYSMSLQKFVRLRVTAAALRTIDKHGGLDGYLLKTKDKDLHSDVGLLLKRQVQKQVGQSRS
jgi:large subunit ribosomal protein L28